MHSEHYTTSITSKKIIISALDSTVKSTIMTTINEIISEAIKNCETDVFYWDAMSDEGYHMQILDDYIFVCFRQTKGREHVITAEEFENAVNTKCHLNSIGEYSYYSIFKKI